MKFRKGSEIEVLSKKEVSSGSWRSAEIISGNGHNYDVKYDWNQDSTGSLMIERVSRKHIRPCPPPVEGAIDWVVGDLVEVLHNVSWKIATVLKVLGGDDFLVKLLGTSLELTVHKSYLRVRQSWQHDRWVVVGKGSATRGDGCLDKLSTSIFYQKTNIHVPADASKAKRHVGDNFILDKNNNGFEEFQRVPTKALKRRSSYATSQVEATGAGRKRRAIEEDGRRQRMVSEHPSPFSEKVDAVASPHNVLGEKYMHASFIKQSGFCKMDMVRAVSNGDVECVLTRSLEPNDADSSVSSVGSCSSSPYRMPFHSLTDRSQEPEDCYSDAESSCGLGYEKECFLLKEDDWAETVHRLELDAYRSTIEALFASGPLSWEQEELVTNLRLKLHISNDEHLMEIRNLVSGSN